MKVACGLDTATTEDYTAIEIAIGKPFGATRQVLCVHADTEGNVWFGTATGLCRLREGAIEEFGTDDGLPDPRVMTIAQGSDKKLWIGTAKGFAQWSNQGIVAAELPPEMEKMNIGVALEDSTGTLWFSLGTEGGFRLQDGKLQELQALQVRAGSIGFGRRRRARFGSATNRGSFSTATASSVESENAS